MKAWISLILLFLVFSLPILSSFEKGEVYYEDASITALDAESGEGEKESTEVDAEDVETKILLSSLTKIFLNTDYYTVFSKLPIFISSYTPSFHIPPIS